MDKTDSRPAIPPFPGVEEIERLRREDEEISGRYDEWDKALKEVERKIDRPASLDLDTMIRAGANRKTLVHLLALTATTGGYEWWKQLARQRRDALRKSARRMETLSAEAEKQTADVTFRGKFYFFLIGSGFAIGMKEPKPLKEVPGISFVISGMRVLAKTYRDEAKQITHFLRHYGRTDSGVVFLLFGVFLWTHYSTDHYDALARLLTDTFEAAGKSDLFSADQLRKIWDRRGKRMLAVWLKLQTEPVPEEPPVSPVGTPVSPLCQLPKIDPKPED